MDSPRSISTDSTRSSSSSIEIVSRKQSTDLQDRTNSIGLAATQKTGALQWAAARVQAAVGRGYIQLQTGSQEKVFVKIDHIRQRLGKEDWSKKDVKQAFQGENGFAKLQHAFALKEMIDQGPVHSIGGVASHEEGTDETDSISDISEEDLEGRSAISDDLAVTMADVLSFNQEKLGDISKVAEKALESLKHKEKSAYVFGKNLVMIDPKSLTIELGSFLGKGVSGIAFKVHDKVVKVHSALSMNTLALSEESLRKEESILKKLNEGGPGEKGAHLGVQEVFVQDRVHRICHIAPGGEVDSREKEDEQDYVDVPTHVSRMKLYEGGDVSNFVEGYVSGLKIDQDTMDKVPVDLKEYPSLNEAADAKASEHYGKLAELTNTLIDIEEGLDQGKDTGTLLDEARVVFTDQEFVKIYRSEEYGKAGSGEPGQLVDSLKDKPTKDIGESDFKKIVSALRKMCKSACKSTVYTLAQTLEVKEKIIGMQRDLAKGYEHTHSKGIVHLDGGPRNYFFDDKGRAVLADYGCAIDFEDEKTIPSCIDEGSTNITPADHAAYMKLAAAANAGGSEAAAAKEKRKVLLQKIDMYLFGISLADMIGISHPEDLSLKGLEARLEGFYGKDSPKVKCIVKMLSSDPEKRPTASKVKETLSTP